MRKPPRAGDFEEFTTAVVYAATIGAGLVAGPPMRKFLTRREAAAFLSSNGWRCTVKTLETYASRGADAPPFHKCGRRVVYLETELQAWLEARLQGPFTSTSNYR